MFMAPSQIPMLKEAVKRPPEPYLNQLLHI